MKVKYYDKLNEKVYSEKLQNGLTVFVVTKPGFAKKYAFFATNYGGADRRFKVGGKWLDTPEGVAHFLEHKMFDTKDGNALEILSSNGASPNAFTSSEMTAYYFSCIDGFDVNLKTLLNFVSVPYFTAESVAKEQGIIGQEIRMTDDEPEYVLYFNLMKCLYSHHPLRHSVAGTVESISEITDQTLYDCHKIFYNPSNMVLCVVGDVDPQSVVDIARNNLPEEKGEVPQRDYGDEEEPKAHAEYKSANMDIGIPLFAAGYKCDKTVNGTDFLRQQLIADLAVNIICGKSSPLYVDLYSQALISSGFSADFETVTDRSHAVFSGESRDPEAVVKAIKEETERIIKSGIDKELFTRVKKSFQGSLLRSLNSFENISAGIASSYFKNCSYFDIHSILNDILITDVEKFVKTQLTPDRFAVSVLTPNQN